MDENRRMNPSAVDGIGEDNENLFAKRRENPAPQSGAQPSAVRRPQSTGAAQQGAVRRPVSPQPQSGARPAGMQQGARPQQSGQRPGLNHSRQDLHGLQY